MERRLVPLNGLLALCRSGDIYPAPLADAGYRLAGIEVPVAAGGGTVVVDVVIFQPEFNILLAGEAKGGANVSPGQAKRYRDLEADDLIRATAISVSAPGQRTVQPLYCCLSENVTRVLHGLKVAKLDAPVLAFGQSRIQHHGASFLDPRLRSRFSAPIPAPGPPPRVFVVDHESPDETFDDLVMTTLVAEMSHSRFEISLPTLAEQAVHHLALYGTAAYNRLVRKVEDAARRIVDADRERFEYIPPSSTRRHAVVRFLRSPEAGSRRVRTQSYQAIRRAFRKGGAQSQTRPQMTLLDLIDEMEQESDVFDDEDMDERE